jgi:hypothetical protein
VGEVGETVGFLTLAACRDEGGGLETKQRIWVPHAATPQSFAVGSQEALRDLSRSPRAYPGAPVSTT